MKEFLDVWRIASPITYTKSRLMDILNKENLSDMHMWLQLMGTENSPKKLEIATMLDLNSSRSGTPRSTLSLSPQPRPLLSPAGSAGLAGPTYHSLPNSPYSWYFESSSSAAKAESESAASSTVGVSNSSSLNMREHGILKKRSASEVDYSYLRGSDSNPSRESTPDSMMSRPYSRFSENGHHSSSNNSTKSGKGKTIR